jgi:hypothetical protein
MENPLVDEVGYTSPPRWLSTAARIVVQEAGEIPKTKSEKPSEPV